MGLAVLAVGVRRRRPRASLVTRYRAGAEVYDASARAFKHGATPLADGRVLLAGGYGGPFGGYLAAVELYDPATGQFGLAGVMTAPRAAHVQLAVGAGDVLVVGGVDGSNLITATVELYQP